MKTKPRKKLKSQKFFNPDEISTLISQTLKRDLSVPQVLGTMEIPVNMLKRRQNEEFLKKYSSPSLDSTPLAQKTYQKFLAVNEHMSFFSGREMYPEPIPRLLRTTSERDKILLRARAFMHSIVSNITEEEWFHECKNSSGSSIGVPFTDTSIEQKLRYPITITRRAKTLFERYLDFNFQLKEALAIHNCTATGIFKFVEGSRSTTVEKNSDIRRMICVEPTGNMFLQQGLMSVLYKRMSRMGLNVKTLPIRHQKLALEASITGKLATIDWSSASDCVSIELLRYLLPVSWFQKVDMTRCSKTTLNGELLELNMISTMGNAVTFPLETLVFYTLAHSIRITLENKSNSLLPNWEELKSCSVFGDDCIVPSYMAPLFIRTMEEVGFLINKDKSFIDPAGRFRESCGGDYLAGYNVRPYYIKAPTSTKKSALEPWLYIILNSLIQKYILCFGERDYIYKPLFYVLFGLFTRYDIDIKIVPSFYPDDSGAKLSFDLPRFLSNYRLNISPIYTSEHGALSFKFCRFQYTERARKFQDLHYIQWLNQPSLTRYDPVAVKIIGDVLNAHDEHYLRRRVGGYVVGKGVTGHWSVPQVSP